MSEIRLIFMPLISSMTGVAQALVADIAGYGDLESTTRWGRSGVTLACVIEKAGRANVARQVGPQLRR